MKLKEKLEELLCKIAQEAHNKAPEYGPGPQYLPGDFGTEADEFIEVLAEHLYTHIPNDVADFIIEDDPDDIDKNPHAVIDIPLAT